MIHVREPNTGTRGFLPVPHVVFSTKYGRRILTGHVREFLYPVMAKICTDVRATLEAFDDEDDQVRPLVCQPPKIAPSTLINSLKGRVVSADQKREVSQNHRPPAGATISGHPANAPQTAAAPRLMLLFLSGRR